MKTKPKELYIIGAGGFGREVADTVHDINDEAPTYRIAGFIDDTISLHGQAINGIEVLGGVEYLRGRAEVSGDKPCVVTTIATPQIRENMIRYLGDTVRWENIIHPLALIKKTARIGEGNIIQHFTSIHANAVVGDHCIINCHCVIGHDVILENFVSIMPQSGLMGFCKAEERVYIGAGVTAIPGVTIGRDAIVGAGAVLIKDAESGATIAGNPAKRIK